MNPTAFKNTNKDYIAHVREREFGNIVAEYWVTPDEVWRGGRGRHQIKYTRNGEVQIKNNHPGAASFELYKAVA